MVDDDDLVDGLSGTDTISLKVTKVTAAKAATQHSTAPPAVVKHSSQTTPPIQPGFVQGSSVTAGGDFLIDDSNYWAGLAAAIELINRP